MDETKNEARFIGPEIEPNLEEERNAGYKRCPAERVPLTVDGVHVFHLEQMVKSRRWNPTGAGYALSTLLARALISIVRTRRPLVSVKTVVSWPRGIERVKSHPRFADKGRIGRGTRTEAN